MTTRNQATRIIVRLAALLILINGSTVFAQSQTSKRGTRFLVQIDETEIEKQLRDEYKDLPEDQIKSRIPTALKRAQEVTLEIMRNRVKALGVSEPLIFPEKDNCVVVQIMGLKEADRERAAKLIQSTGLLVFSIVHADNDKLVSALFERGLAPEGFQISASTSTNRQHKVYRRDTKAVPDETMTIEFRAKLERFQAPPGYRFMLEERQEEGQKIYSAYFVKQRYELRGDTLKNAAIEYDQLGQPYVTLKFDSKGARKFARVTADLAPGGAKNPTPEGRRYLAIIMDDRLYSAPFIKTAIYGGEAIIEGSFMLNDAQDMAIVLRSGSLPAPVQIIEVRTMAVEDAKTRAIGNEIQSNSLTPAVSSVAQTQTSRRTLAEELVKMTKTKERMEKTMATAEERKQNPEEAKMMDDYISQMNERMIKLYEETYTEDELKFLVKFNKSPLSAHNSKDMEIVMALTEKLTVKAQAMVKEAQSNSPSGSIDDRMVKRTQSKRPPPTGTPFSRALKTSQQNKCMNNLRQIEAAKDQYGLENGLTNGAVISFAPLVGSDGLGYLKKWPVCPDSTNASAVIRNQGMTENDYDINVMGSNAKCRIHPESHVLP